MQIQIFETTYYFATMLMSRTFPSWLRGCWLAEWRLRAIHVGRPPCEASPTVGLGTITWPIETNGIKTGISLAEWCVQTNEPANSGFPTWTVMLLLQLNSLHCFLKMLYQLEACFWRVMTGNCVPFLCMFLHKTASTFHLDSLWLINSIVICNYKTWWSNMWIHG